MKGFSTQGRFCDGVDEDGVICNALMVEKSVFYHCPACGHIHMLPAAELQQKLAKEQGKTNRPAYMRVGAANLAIDSDDVFSSPHSRSRGRIR